MNPIFNVILFIGTTEIIFILLIVVMLFGADKIPEIARGLGKGINMVKHASSDIKNEITKSAEKSGVDTSITKDITEEVNKVKDEIQELTGSVKRKL
ncbi:twin-arginine translocase TatA/TatE family subunit [Paucihalobacter ruber]|uniref:Sec-independent protein translocase protein TatA n=1 Tax=Paucihalobacter ruber TaxID=2567861 RepID=A0A506PP53_9FLAO|nr:twin-arginine translocase TatA/TatE family subunit [Paucihalobacter ruber]TPV35683.1 twin-arginine translocase TatA/TatE family subunit [Paucihalobacter ruber]